MCYLKPRTCFQSKEFALVFLFPLLQPIMCPKTSNWQPAQRFILFCATAICNFIPYVSASIFSRCASNVSFTTVHASPRTCSCIYIQGSYLRKFHIVLYLIYHSSGSKYTISCLLCTRIGITHINNFPTLPSLSENVTCCCRWSIFACPGSLQTHSGRQFSLINHPYI